MRLPIWNIPPGDILLLVLLSDPAPHIIFVGQISVGESLGQFAFFIGTENVIDDHKIGNGRQIKREGTDNDCYRKQHTYYTQVHGVPGQPIYARCHQVFDFAVGQIAVSIFLNSHHPHIIIAKPPVPTIMPSSWFT
ncbi:MAG TPA: hypothetical protein VMZ32_13270 [Gammaproteobacteria bacterium]|nr:hypothetical protein [Gammaproteobacteria bacterium]